jgi:glycosyltransferase involved in cell wall biosynthesis
MIFLNPGKYIDEAIRSVLSQTYANWELLLVDDGSSDESTSIARGFAESHPERVRLLSHPDRENRGMSASRLAGIHAARGQLVAFLDADDVFVPEKLARQVAMLAAHPEVGAVFGPTQLWRSWRGHGADTVTNLGVALDAVYAPPALATSFLRAPGSAPAICSFLVRREVFDAGITFEPAFRHSYDDQTFYFKLFLTTEVYAASESLERYRQHPGGITSVFERSGGLWWGRRAFLERLAQLVGELEVDDPDLRSALEAALWPFRDDPGVATGRVDFGDLRRLTPLSRDWGYDRGTPVDRYYIERFLATFASDVRGRVLEVGDDAYTRRFGGAVAVAEVLHVRDDVPGATIVADLAQADNVPSNAFDCIVFTQTLQLIFDTRAAIRTLHRILKPGGVLLATFPGISQIDRGEWADSWYWSFTARSARRLFEETFSPGLVDVDAHGNVLAATAFLQGLAQHELRWEELDYRDPAYELVITVRAVKADGSR